MDESANEMYAKVLSISDELMLTYYELLSEISSKDFEKLKLDLENGALHPKIAKENLALELVARFHSQEKAKMAKDEFDRVHSQNALPSDMAEFSLQSDDKNELWLVRALVECALESSSSNARRDIKARAVSVNGEKIEDENFQLARGEYILQVGKRKFAKLKVL